MSRAVPRFRRINPPLPAAVPNLFEVIVQGLVEGQVTINTFYYADGGGALIAATEQNIAAGWITAFGAQFRAACSSDWTLTSVKVLCLTSPNRMPFVSVQSLAGTGPAGHEPTQIGFVVVRKSGVRGQAGRGRVTMPAMPTTWVTGSILSALGITGVGAFQAMPSTGFVASTVTYTAQIVSKKNKSGPALGASPVLTSIASPTVGTVRRRKLGRGK